MWKFAISLEKFRIKMSFNPILMKPIRLCLCMASIFLIPLILLFLTGCGVPTETDDSLVPKEINNEDTAPSIPTSQEETEANITPTVDSEQPVLNPEGVAGPSLAVVLFPNGNEQLEAGKQYDITWDAQGFNTLNIELEEEGYTRGVIAEDVLAANGVYTWTPAFTDGTEDGHTMNLQVVLSDADTGEVLDKSDKSFIIIESTEE